MQCLNLLLSWLKCNVIKSHLATLVIIVIMPWLTPELVQFLHPQKNKDISPLFSVIYRNRWPHFLKQFWYFISYTNVFSILYDAFKLKAGNNELIWHGWYPPHITVVLLLLYIYFYGLTSFFLNSNWLKSLKNKQKIGTLI